ncbi:MAG TPA: GNAT family N-acetyltransferase [Candidatus Binataceae bacterium]
MSGPIGVLPELQGRGVGKALVGSFPEMVDNQGLPAYLETDVDSNVALYEKFGFKMTAQENLMGINNRFMWRETRSSPGGGIELSADLSREPATLRRGNA